jgi:hypothetical protein
MKSRWLVLAAFLHLLAVSALLIGVVHIRRKQAELARPGIADRNQGNQISAELHVIAKRQSDVMARMNIVMKKMNMNSGQNLASTLLWLLGFAGPPPARKQDDQSRAELESLRSQQQKLMTELQPGNDELHRMRPEMTRYQRDHLIYMQRMPGITAQQKQLASLAEILLRSLLDCIHWIRRMRLGFDPAPSAALMANQK